MMMSMLDWTSFWIGLLSGTLASSLYFAGLALGMRLALQRDNPAGLLFISAAVRITLLLWSGSWIASQGLGAIIGFALSFIVIRSIITTLVRPCKRAESVQWN